MKKKIFSVLFALMLVLSFSLMTAVPVMAVEPTTTLSIPDNVYRPAPFDVSGTTTNSDTEYGNVRFNITVDGPVDFTGGQADTFTITYADDPLGIQGFNETFVLEGGNFVGYWGPVEGFPLPTDYDVASIFTIQMNDEGTAPLGDYEVTVELVDLTPEPVTLATATAGFSLSDDTLYVGSGQQFTTIQNAIDAADDGDTINVAAGIYTEWQDNGYGQSAGIIIDKPLHLQGSGDDCIIRGKTGTAYHMPYSPIVWVKADNVEIDHFKFDGATYTETEPKGLRSYGIQSAWEVNAATNLNVHHNTFVFIGTAVTQDRAGGGDITVAYNTMVRETRNIWYDPPGPAAGYVDKTLGGGGVNLWGVVGGTVHDNTGIETPGVGISLYGCQDLTIGPNNVVSAPNTTDPSDIGIYINGGSNITVTGNTVSNFKNGEDPMYNCGKKGAGISIDSGGCDGFTIENNNLTNNSVGVYVATVESMDTPTNVAVHFNNIEGNDDYGVCNFRFPPGMRDPVTGERLKHWEYDKFYPANNDVDATNNWWNHASGPTHDSNPLGTGDAVSNNVDAEPWLISEGGNPFDISYDDYKYLPDDWSLISPDRAWSNWEALIGDELVVTYAYGENEPGVFGMGFRSPGQGSLSPLTALYIKTVGGSLMGINYPDTDWGMYATNLEVGWNLIGIPDTGADTYEILAHLKLGANNEVALATLVSQGNYNPSGFNFYQPTLSPEDWAALAEEELNPFDGYWASMNVAKEFGVIVVERSQ